MDKICMICRRVLPEEEFELDYNVCYDCADDYANSTTIKTKIISMDKCYEEVED